MNVFVSDKCPVKSAKDLDNILVMKMTTEVCQIGLEEIK